jgi:molybdenum cofactor cytidylyltransferase
MLDFHGQPVITRVIDKAGQPGIQSILVVLGAFRDDMVRHLEALDVIHCYNSDFKKGMLSSIQCGIRNLPDGTDAMMLFLGDQPMVPEEAPGLLMREYYSSGKGIIIPVFRGRRGHPVLIDTKYTQAILKLDQEGGLRALFRDLPGEIAEVETDNSAILRDMDEISDYIYELNIN